VIVNRAGGFSNYDDAARRTSLLGQLSSMVQQYDGLVLDFVPGTGYTQFVADLAGQLSAQSRSLAVVIRESDWGSQDVLALSQHVDRIWLAPGGRPESYQPGGIAQIMLEELAGQVERAKIGLLVDASHVDVAPDTVTTISFEEAAARFGIVEPVPGYVDPATPAVLAGMSLPLYLTGSVASLGYDAPAGTNFFTYYDDAGELHHVYLSSAQSLNARLAWAERYALRWVAVQGIAAPDVGPDLAEGLKAFLLAQVTDIPMPLLITWAVSDTAGAVLEETEGGLSLMQYRWLAPDVSGQFTISATLQSDTQVDSLGQVVVAVEDTQSDGPESQP
jgi:hypothetical protein